MTIKAFLNQPYIRPAQGWKSILIIGVGISMIMFLMEPFGLSTIHMDHKSLFLMGYGLVTSSVLGINSIVVIRTFVQYKWNIIRYILWCSVLIFLLGLANYAYTFYFLKGVSFSFNALFVFQIYTFFIAIIPVTFLVLIRQNHLLKTNQSGAALLTERLSNANHQDEAELSVCFLADNGKSQIDVKIENLAFVESVGNYIHLYSIKNDEMVEQILRSSITKALMAIGKHKTLLKCHRAFIVNLNFVEQVSGNAQGFRLTIKKTNKEVYVSRSYTKILRDVLK